MTPDYSNWPHVAVVTLMHNSRRFIDEYFSAFDRVRYPQRSLELHVLDNGSRDGSWENIQANVVGSTSLNLTVNRSEKNLGFAGGNNHVLRALKRRADIEYFLLINIDTQIEEGCLEELVAMMERENDTGMVEAIQRPREHPKWYDPHTLETGWCSCGGVLIRKTALQQVGLFDRKFFLYCEDVDLSWRMWMHGWKCKINPKAAYMHFTEGLDNKKDGSIQLYYSLRNSFFLHFKYDTWSGTLRHIRMFNESLKDQDERTKNIYREARRRYKKYIPLLLLDRLRLIRCTKGSWIVFDGFNYEKRRKYVDTEDGRTILNGLGREA